jgi:glycosyltransferase involved in cell wall biosynthesis
MPRVSVIFPVFDAEHTVDRALQSLSAQSLTDWECWAVDDGSTDQSARILADWAGRDPRVHVLAQPHAGIVSALNAGLDRASAPFIARLDADDVCRSARLERQCAFLEAHPGIGVASCQVSYQSTFGPQGGFATYVDWTNALLSSRDHWLNRFIDAPVVHPTIMARRELYDRFGAYRDTPPWPEDFELWLRWMHAGVAFAKVPEVLYTWTDRPDRLSRRDRRYAMSRFYECKAAYLASGPLRDTPAIGVWGAGRLTRKRAELLVRHNIDIRFYVDVDPRRIGQRIHDRPVLSRAELDDAPAIPLVSFVASRGARDEIRGWLRDSRYVEGENFWCAA